MGWERRIGAWEDLRPTMRKVAKGATPLLGILAVFLRGAVVVEEGMSTTRLFGRKVEVEVEVEAEVDVGDGDGWGSRTRGERRHKLNSTPALFNSSTAASLPFFVSFNFNFRYID